MNILTLHLTVRNSYYIARFAHFSKGILYNSYQIPNLISIDYYILTNKFTINGQYNKGGMWFLFHNIFIVYLPKITVFQSIFLKTKSIEIRKM